MTHNPDGRGVIFDLDGVLIDTADYHKQSWYDLADRRGWQLTDEQFYKTFGMQNARIIPLFAGHPCSPEQIVEMSAWKEQRYRELITGRLTLLDGVESLIQNLRNAGFKIAVGTSTPRVNLEFMFDQTRSRGWFDTFATSEDVVQSKPAPDTFLKAAEKLNLPPYRCVVVEDAIPGVQAAQAAEMPVIAVTNTRTRAELAAVKPDYIVDSLAQLSPNDFNTLINNQQIELQIDNIDCKFLNENK